MNRYVAPPIIFHSSQSKQIHIYFSMNDDIYRYIATFLSVFDEIVLLYTIFQARYPVTLHQNDKRCTIQIPMNVLITYIMDYRVHHPIGYIDETEWRPLCQKIWIERRIPETVYIHTIDERRSVFVCHVQIDDDSSFRCQNSSHTTFCQFMLSDIFTV